MKVLDDIVSDSGAQQLVPAVTQLTAAATAAPFMA
jgi:hypothetical protein